MIRPQLLSGLVVASDVPLPGAAKATPGAAPDFTVVRAGTRRVPSTIAEGKRLQAVAWRGELQYSTTKRSDGTVHLRIHGLVDFLVEPEGETIRAWVDPGCSAELLAILIAGNLLATVLMLRGEIVLHASAVESGGRAVAFVAHSGMGKSTLAALACAAGAAFVADDLLRLRVVSGEPVRCWRGGAENRLRRPVSQIVAGPTPVRTSVDGRQVWQPTRSAEPCPELAAVVLPVLDRAVSSVSVEQLAPGPAILELSLRPRLLGWTDPVGRARVFADLATVVRSVHVVRARVPWGPPFDPRMAAELLSAVGCALQLAAPEVSA